MTYMEKEKRKKKGINRTTPSLRPTTTIYSIDTPMNASSQYTNSLLMAKIVVQM